MKESSNITSHLEDPEFRHAYAASFMNSYVAAQIKTIREQREMTQSQLAELIGTQQAGISRLENVNYDAWKVSTLQKLAKAFDVRLRISFEEFDSLLDEFARFNRSYLERAPYEETRQQSVVLDNDPTPSDSLCKALNPKWQPPQSRVVTTDRESETGENHARDIDPTSKGLRLLAARRVDDGDGNISPQSDNLFRQEMPIREGPKYATGT